MGAGRDDAEPLRALEARLRAEDPGWAERIDAHARRLAGHGAREARARESRGPRREPVPRTAVAMVCGAFAFALLMLVLAPLLVQAG